MRSLILHLLPVFLRILLAFAQGDDPIDEQVSFEVREGLPPNTLVGTIPIRGGLSYAFSEPSDEFKLDALSGAVRTRVILDRESLADDTIDIFVKSTPAAKHLVEVQITVLDVNDNPPVYDPPSIDVSFVETDSPGTQVVLATATDRDIGSNGMTSNYEIISGNEEGKFRLVILTDTSIPLMYLENRVMLDREDQDSYVLNISARDGGNPPKYGYLRVNVAIKDYNDHPPLFDQSDYSAEINETAAPGSFVLTVRATDQDVGSNGEITYSIVSDDLNQFAIDPLSGDISILTSPSCYHQCDPTDVSCHSKTCLITIEARDNGRPFPLTGRAFVSVVLVDVNDHDPIVSFGYSSNTPYATVEEGATEDTVVALVKVADSDEGDNGRTESQIVRGNELNHFKLDPSVIPGLLILKVAGKLDREKVSRYNITVEARDFGSPSRKSQSYLIIVVNDINDHKPIFVQPSYACQLREGLPLGSFVESVTATDNDTGINAAITYEIISGNNLGWFEISSTTGLVITSKALDREQESRVQLTIRARDGAATPYSTTTTLNITILDENDESPIFGPYNPELSFPEGTRAGLALMTFSAVDLDQGKNGSVEYHLDSSTEKNYPDMFEIDVNSGTLHNLQEFDRESFAEYHVSVIAVDKADAPLTSTASILIIVDDLNDNAPVFYPLSYYAFLYEGVEAGSPVVQVLASDLDAGSNAAILYSLTQSSNSFEIERETGLIKTTETLSSRKYTLGVAASDAGGLSAAESATVEIMFVRPQDPAPVFSQPDGYSFSIAEDDSVPVVGRNVGRVTASGQGQLLYDISDGNPEGSFVIDSISGQINSAKPLDRESVAVYSLKVVASSEMLFSTVLVNVTIADQNDNIPLFPSAVVETSVRENWPVGHDVHLSAAHDPDTGDNGRLIYHLTPGSSPVFSVDDVSGMISVAQPLGELTDSTLEVYVVASDSGSPTLSSQQTVRIYIEDVNDHTPAFEHTGYEVSVNEAEKVNSRFFHLSASDEDLGNNGHVSYQIINGNKEHKFGIFPDGYLYIAQALDRELVNLYVLSIKAYDHGLPSRSSLANITISVQDSNDNNPKFSNSTFGFSLAENSPRGSSVGTVYASDKDTGKNAELSFYIDGENNGFAINARSGMITAAMSFDREVVISEYGADIIRISVVVEDEGEPVRQDRSSVEIRITDLNDNPPVFTQSISQLTLYENTEVGSQIASVSANDADTGVNADIRYSILSGDGTFSVDPIFGQISLNKSVDRETTDYYRIIIMAMDEGDPPLSSTTIVAVTLLDFNDNQPKFVLYENATISEATEVGRELFTIKAIDDDIGLNSVIEYSIVGGNIDTAFHIDTNSGSVSLAAALDYEEQSLYTLTIQASDLGTPALVNTIKCWVTVEDINDHAPLFTSSPVLGYVTENAPVSSSVLVITANDEDSGANGFIMYSLKRQDPPGWAFKINEESGLITTTKNLDHETADSYQLTVVAIDQAYPSSTRKTSEKTVTINVHDLNDNAPQFTSVTAVPVLVGSQANTLVTTVTALDLDSGMNGRVSYEIYNGDTDMFRINTETGDLYLRSALNSQVLAYDLTIRGRDNGPDRKSSFFQLKIFTRSSEDNGPTFGQTSYSGQVFENQPPGTSIVSVSASYLGSSSGSMEYYITAIESAGTTQPRFFQIQPTSGLISTSEELDREAGYDVFNLEVYAVDKSSNQPRTSKCSVQITLLDKNDSPPEFGSDLYELTMSEDSSPGDIVSTVVAMDADESGSVSYSIREGAEKKFDIDPLRGEIRVVGSLDRETKPSYALIVVADDGNQRSETKVIVEVTDVNDQAPQFTEPIYAFNIAENTRSGARLGRISATDLDEGDNAQLTYSLLTHFGRDRVSIHPHSGIITLIGSLDYEQIPLYVLTVKVQDSGPVTLSSTATVLVNVIDTNDNAPIFDPSTYSDQVWENATIGTEIVGVSATDIDTGNNGRVLYSITGGDIDHRFTVNAETGIIYVAKSLDRETQAHYNLAIEARDMADDPRDQLSSTAVVTVILKDCNDHAPQFESSPYFDIMENSAIGTSVHQVTTTDLDEGQNRLVEFSLSDTSSFTIGKNDGVIRLNRVFDREEVESVEFVVIAHDKGVPALTTSLTYTAVIVDANDNSPEVNPSEYEITIDEDEPIGSRLLEVYASDLDVGLNSDLRFSIVSGDPNNDFMLNSHTGELSVYKKLDYERVTSYNLIVAVEDQGEPTLSGSARIVVQLEDVNDCIPKFMDSPYVAYVQENVVNVPVHVTQLTARDEDTGSYGRVSYSILEGDRSLFRINSTTGEITAMRTLDREEVSSYELTISAMDTGSPRLTGTGVMTIRIGDDNDNTPTFEHSFYRADVKENQAAMTSVTSVTAIDADAGQNAQIKYSLSNSGGGRFGINEETGEIHTLVSLNREEIDKYKLVAMATDSGRLALSSSVVVMVTVGDENDRVPRFLQKEYSVQIQDPTSAGWFIVGVTAIDEDAGENGRITYSLLGDAVNDFSIDADNGIITAARELTSRSGGYQLNIRATDNGGRALTNSAIVYVNFLPSSVAGFPVFTSTQSSFRLSESISLNGIVTTVTATSPREQATISYAIAGGNTDDTFAINNEGQVTVQERLDFEKTQSYQLWVEAQDNSDPPLSSYQNLVLDIVDENDNAPVFTVSYYNASVPEEEFATLTVVHVSAVDADSGDNGRISYALDSGNEAGVFMIDRSSGIIRTQMKLDRETVSEYRLVVSATDHGNPRQTSTTTIDVHIIDKNDRPPVFSEHFNIRFPESLPVGSFVLRISSTDGDIGVNAMNTYTFISSVPQFAIDPSSGNITVAAPLDRETKDEYILDVAANDGAYNSETSVSIFILDVNDNQPVFDMNSYSFSIVSGSPIGTSIGQISASDNDAPGPNSDIFFRFKEPSSLFIIDPDTGVVSSRQEVLFKMAGNDPSPENIQRLLVLVIDRGEPPLKSEVQLTISILPVNENPPVFDQAEFEMLVDETWPVGKEIGFVLASDPDYGPNSQLLYTITSGDADFFSLAADTGLVTLSSSVSSRVDTEFNLRITASDRGMPSKSATANVKIRVLEQNQNSPRFTGSSQAFQTTVPEGRPVGSTIGKVTAADSDQGLNGDITYAIVSGNDLGLLEVDSAEGYISVAKALDYETKKVIVLNITASDSGATVKSSWHTFTVTVTDDNDNGPVFEQTIYKATVQENSVLGTRVFELSATDADENPNNIIKYSMTGTQQALSYFMLDTDTIRVNSLSLDYEQMEEIEVNVAAENPGETKIGTATVLVTLTGQNEFMPEFNQAEYSFTVSESATIGYTFGSVRATDQDSGQDGIVQYSLVGDSNLKGFTVDIDTGVLVISDAIDREATSEIILDVVAKNQGPITGADLAICQVRVSISDANDPPQFTQSLYEGSIREDARVGTTVLKLSAVDNDLQNSFKSFRYSIINGNSDDSFSVNQASGWVTTNSRLDREKHAIYNLTVAAVDTGNPPQTGTSSVKIYLDDINDNGPFFSPPLPIGYVQENSPSLSVNIIDLNQYCDDPDLDPNRGPYRFSLLNSSLDFTIDATSGVVRARKSFDREVQDEYYVQVKVEDDGSIVMTSALTFKVEVTDQNDNPSRSRLMEIKTYVFEGRYNGGLIADVRPLDDDLEGSYSCDLVSSDGPALSIPYACELHASSSQDMGSFELSIKGSDGIHPVVSYLASVDFVRFDQGAIDHALVIRVANIKAATFIESFLQRFRDSLSSQMISNSDETLLIFAVNEVESDVDVFVVVATANGGYVTKETALTLISIARLESDTGVKLRSLDTSACDNTPCRNGGTCSSDVTLTEEISITAGTHRILSTSPGVHLSSICKCQQGYTGDNCDEHIDACKTSPCLNNGVCTSTGAGTYSCKCPPQFKGSRCENDVNECAASNPCLNGGTCSNTVGSYYCRCLDEFSGPNCGIAANNCGSGPCLNGGICDRKGLSPKCKCQNGDRGEHCEIRAKNFRELSYMEYSLQLDQVSNDIEVEFATTKENALLVFFEGDNPATDFLALEIINGQATFTFSAGYIVPGRVAVPGKVNDGNWHRLEASRIGNVGKLKVMGCGDGSECEECMEGDSACFRRSQQLSDLRLLDNDATHSLLIGGLRSKIDITRLLTDLDSTLSTHDFYGCIRALRVDTQDVFTLSNKANTGVTDGCSRTREGSACKGDVCHNGGLCRDEWTTVSCDCAQGYTGQACDKETESFSLGPNSLITFTQRESYIRDQMTNDEGRRKRRAADDVNQLTVEFRTTNSEGVMFFSEDSEAQNAIFIQNDNAHFYVFKSGNVYSLSSSKSVSDGHWHNITVQTSGVLATLNVDSTVVQRTLPIGWPPLVGTQTQTFSLAGTPSAQPINGSKIQGFEGCLKHVLLNQGNLPLEGSTARFEISRHGNVSNQCPATFHAPMGRATGDSPPVHIAVIVIVVFFAIVLIVLLVVFFVIRKRRQQKQEEKPQANANKENGQAVIQNGSLSEEAIIRQHIEAELNTRGDERALGSRPDLVVADGRSVPIRESNVVLEPNGFHNSGFMEEPPEHYDIDNASSIAPSDLVDVVQHYKQYRRGMLNNDSHRPPRVTPSPLSMLPPRQSPNPLKYGAQYRQSPLTVNNLNTGPPKPLSRKSPGLNIDPRGGPSVRSTPLSGLEGLYSPGSNISSSSSYDQPNIPPSRPGSHLRQPISSLGIRSTPTIGLTVDEVNRMNSRRHGDDDESSSSDAAINQKINATDFTHADLQNPPMPPSSSSSESDANDDAFTCSEFDFDADRIPRMQPPRLASVNEDDPPQRPHWDHLLNWGPNFEGLVGVFTDIAQLPDANPNTSLPPRGRVSPRPRSTTPQPRAPTPQKAPAKSPTPRSVATPSPLHVIEENGPYRENGIDHDQVLDSVHEEYV